MKSGRRRKLPIDAIENLSPRELEVFRGIGNAKSIRAIAAELGINVKTVQSHRANINEKLGGITALEANRIAAIWVWEQERVR